ncbi:MAG: N-acylneuraminate-9-phosphate synthase [Parcubacteria group bacterium GW2011_GWA1_47_10]|uniref:N-acylneuraminate-9-phosphate synthase n=1 Tax=Candidatus Nomurabacteria bacterium GW2011_GWB1_47_6 TaxID=1618749 RepID=A0A0G1VBI7_9BACT|nr:MAG: N-acylneuraminate-9-phosphate synthase [Parcubacteria group bacterium GW2011_GWA1_47_10]KKU75528.1 MAG: N-acylneuraminate-9-phosphate synthase [Candidatus Nomurabacteria bacterium GW2011_GWB1_47_6]HXK35913.1 N-acetylneuraminate synthase family protein [Candidatus Paceibacterota bacterium]
MKKNPQLTIQGRDIGLDFPPLVVAEIGINHEGSLKKAKQMIDDAKTSGAECVKFQSHIVEDEMVPAARGTIPANAQKSIWEIVSRCSFSAAAEADLKAYTEKRGLIYLSTPFSRAAADRLKKMRVPAYKIGSGECNNYPLVEHVAAFGKPMIVSTGMNDIPAIRKTVKILRRAKVPFALLHCTSVYPTPYDKVRLGSLSDLQRAFPDAVIGLSDHSLGNYTCLGAVALGASILEKHFTSKKSWPGPDVPISIDPGELRDLTSGANAVFAARGGNKTILTEEKPTINFAYACVVATRDIPAGAALTKSNIWVKRPGTGEIKAEHFPKVLGRKAKVDIKKDEQLTWKTI